MSFDIIKQPFSALERGWTLVTCELTVGATGAVSAVAGKRFNSGAASGNLGGIARDSAAVYTITLPGTGGVQEIKPLAPVIIDGAAADAKVALCTARSASARTVTWTFLDQLTAAVEELSNGSVVLFSFLVRDSSVS